MLETTDIFVSDPVRLEILKFIEKSICKKYKVVVIWANISRSFSF
jgi:hypothetical protein